MKYFKNSVIFENLKYFSATSLNMHMSIHQKDNTGYKYRL